MNQLSQQISLKIGDRVYARNGALSFAGNLNHVYVDPKSGNILFRVEDDEGDKVDVEEIEITYG